MPIPPPSNSTVLESERGEDTRSRLLRTHNKRGISRTGFGFGVAGAGNSTTTATTAATPTTPATESTSQPPALRQGPVTRSTTSQPQQPLRLSPYHPQLHQSTSPEDDQTITRSRAAQYGPSGTEERIRRRRASLSSPQGSPVVEEKRKSVATDASISRARSGRAPPSSWASREPERRPPSSSSNVSRPGSAAGKTTGERASVTRSASQSRDGGVPGRQKSVSRRTTSTTTAAASAAQTPKPSLSRSSSVTRQTRSTTANATPASRPSSRPPSIASTRRDTEMKPPPSKAAFSTYQRAYSPTKRSTSTTTTPARQPSRASGANNTLSVRPSNAPSIDDVRQQAELLQLSILHAAAAPTARAWTSSAYKALAAKFSALGQQYDDLSALERTARQHRNLVAMHNWTAGNTRSLTRKLILLQFVLEELCALTYPGDRPPGSNGYQPSALSNCGRYTYIVIQFSTWAAWVKSIWSQRDLEEALAAKAASSSMHRGFQDEYGDATVLTPPSSRDTNSAPIWSPRRAQRYTPIDGLGDATKSELRALSRVLDSLASKLEDTNGAHIPAVEEPIVDGWNDQSRKAGPQTPGKGGIVAIESSVSAAYRLAKTLLDGMREELQLLREVEFEVVAGEKIWVDEMLKGMEDP